MLESVLLIVDRLISLVKTREEANKAYLKDIVEPLMEQTDKAYSDMVKFFQETRSALKAASESKDIPKMKTILLELSLRRTDFKAARDKIATLAEVYRKHCDDPAMQMFFDDISKLFAPYYGYPSIAQKIIDAFERLTLKMWDDDIEGVERLLAESEQLTSYAWKTICREYAELKIVLGTPLQIRSSH